MSPLVTKLVKIGLPIVQLIVGGTFLFSGFTKAIDPVGANLKLEDYFIAFGVTIPLLLQQLLAMLQALFESVLGVCILLGLWKKASSQWMLAFMAVMTVFTFYLAVANPVSDCGCFGDVVKLTNWETFGKNVVLLVLAFLYFRYHELTPTYYGKRTSRWSALWCGLFALLLSAYAYRFQPVMDFLPFKVGNDLNVLTASTPDSIAYQFVYEKNGVKQSFTVDSLPPTDKGWTYVDRTEVLIRKGTAPIINNLAILHPTQGDVTGRLLSDTSYVFLYAAPKLEMADRTYIHKAVEASLYARRHGYAFYGLTASDRESIDEWRYEYDIPFVFCAADDKLLVTMTRSNPGLLLLKHGVIVRKWAYREIPEFAALKKPLHVSSIGQLRPVSGFRTHGILVLIFAFPLVYFHQLHTGKKAWWKHKLAHTQKSI